MLNQKLIYILKHKQFTEKYYLPFFILLILFISTGMFAQTSLFNAGYDDATTITTPTNITYHRTDIEGGDDTVNEPNDWTDNDSPLQTSDVPNYAGNLPPIWIQDGHDDGTINSLGDMIASLVADPDDANNTVLKFTINEHNGFNGRLQTNVKYEQDYLYGESKYQNGLKYIHYKTKLYIPDDFDWMLATEQENSTIYNNEYDFMTLAEFFNCENSNDCDVGNSFRISLNLHKNSGEDWFVLTIKGEEADGSGWELPVWDDKSDEKIGKVDSDLDYELNRWLDLDVTLIEGDDNNGRFILKIGATEIFNINERTHHLNDARLDGFHHIMPQKLYTRDPVVDGFTSGDVLHVFWDDFFLEYVPVENYSCNRVDANDNDVEERLTSPVGQMHAYMYPSGNNGYLDLGLDDKLIGLQFDGYSIPKYAKITNAYIEFVAKADGTGTCITDIWGENLASPTAFGTGDDNLSDREVNATSTVVEWTIPNWTEEEIYQTDDISGIIKDILNEHDDNIEASDVISIILDPTEDYTTNNSRSAVSYDSESTEAPRLCITYENQIVGTIVSNCGQSPIAVPGISVKITPTEDDPCPDEFTTIPDSEGDYSQVTCGETTEYTIDPSKTNESNCGLTTYDLALIRDYINGDEDALLSAYSRIAADVNFDDDIDNDDYSKIWGAIFKTPSSTYYLDVPWVFLAFINNKYYTDPGTSGVPTYTETITDDFPRVDEAKFYIQKMGDVDCDCVPGEPWTPPYADPAPHKVKLIFSGDRFDKDDIINVAIKIDSFIDITAYQIGLAFDSDTLEYISASPGDLNNVSVASNFDFGEVDDGIIRTIWVYETSDTITLDTSLSNGSTFFNITFKALEDITSLPDEVWLDDLILANVAFESNGTVHTFDLNSVAPLAADRSSEEEISYKKPKANKVECFPNPAANIVNFKLNLVENSRVQFNVFDQLARNVFQKEMELAAGQQLVTLDNINVWGNGIYFYSIKINDTVHSGKFIKATTK